VVTKEIIAAHKSMAGGPSGRGGGRGGSGRSQVHLIGPVIGPGENLASWNEKQRAKYEALKASRQTGLHYVLGEDGRLEQVRPRGSEDIEVIRPPDHEDRNRLANLNSWNRKGATVRGLPKHWRHH